MSWIVSSQFTRKRAREEEIEAAEKAKREREWQKNFEVSSSVIVVTTLYKWKHDNAISVSKWLFLSFFRKQEMGVWTVGGPSRPKARKPRRKRTGPSSNPRKSRWNRENDAEKLDFIKTHYCKNPCSVYPHLIVQSAVCPESSGHILTLTNVVLYLVFLMYIFVIWTQRSHLPHVRKENDASSTSVTYKKNVVCHYFCSFFF